MSEINNGTLITLVIMAAGFLFTTGFIIGAIWGALKMAKKTIAQVDEWMKEK